MSERTAERPIFVVGYQRSGTTLLQSLLGAHRRIAAPPETHFIFRIADLADFYGDLAEDTNLRRALHDTLSPPVPLFADCGFDEDQLFQQARSRERTYAALLDTVMSDFAARHGKQRWCEKTPTQPADAVFRLFPMAQVVHIVRDPRDVIASSLETPWTRSNAVSLARAWSSFTATNIRSGFEAGPASFIQVRYEDLTRDPPAVLRQVCTFLGEEFDPGMISEPERRRPTIAKAAAPWQARAMGPIAPAAEGSWRKRLNANQRALIGAILQKELLAFGYSKASRRQVFAGRMILALRIPRALGDSVRLRRLRGTGADPHARYTAVQRFMKEQGEHVAAPPHEHSGRTSAER
jgi:sulfotransferase family protein